MKQTLQQREAEARRSWHEAEAYKAWLKAREAYQEAEEAYREEVKKWYEAKEAWYEARMEQLAKKYKVNLDVYDVFLMDMYKQFLAPKRESKELNPFIFDESLPTCVIFDLDGTLSCMGDRSPYNGEQCEVDTPNESIIELLKMTQYYDSNPNIQTIIFSGRNGEAISQTMDWLIENEVDFDELHMRNPGDQRKDSVVKREMFDEFIKDKYNVLFVVDDRDQVVEMWRSMGLTCLQVNYGDF